MYKRQEKTTRPFLRSREFWWQEGHTIHETAADAEAETQQQLNCYADTCEQDLAIPCLLYTSPQKVCEDYRQMLENALRTQEL